MNSDRPFLVLAPEGGPMYVSFDSHIVFVSFCSVFFLSEGEIVTCLAVSTCRTLMRIRSESRGVITARYA